MPVSKDTNRNSLVLIATTFVVVGGRLLWFRLLPIYLRDLGASDRDIGFVFSVATMLLGPTQLLGGYVTDRWGRHYAISIPTILLVIPLALGISSQTWIAAAAATWLMSFFGGLQQPAFQALLAESSTDRNRGRLFAIFNLALAAAALIGPFVGSMLVQSWTIQGLIAANLLIALVAGAARILLLRDVATLKGPANSAPMREFTLSRHGLMLVIVGALVTTCLTISTEGPFVSLHVVDVLGYGTNQLNLLFAIGGVGSVTAALLAGVAMRNVRLRTAAAFNFIGHTILLWLWAVTASKEWYGVGTFVLSWMAAQVGVIAFGAWYSAFVPVQVRGRILGLAGAIGSLVSGIGPQAGSLVRSVFVNARISAFGSASPFLIAIALSVLAAVILTAMPDRSMSFSDPAATKP